MVAKTQEESTPSPEYQAREDAYAEQLSGALILLEDIKKHTIKARKAMDRDPADANTLANEVVELAILNQRLGDRVAKAGMLARDAENFYKIVREEHKVRLTEGKNPDGSLNVDPKTKKAIKIASGVADSMKYKLAEEEFSLYNMAAGLLEQLSYMRRSTDKTIDAIRSKLSYEKSDYKKS